MQQSSVCGWELQQIIKSMAEVQVQMVLRVFVSCRIQPLVLARARAVLTDQHTWLWQTRIDFANLFLDPVVLLLQA